MDVKLLIAILAICSIALILIIVLLFRRQSSSGEGSQKLLASELKAGREEAGRVSRALREEVAKSQKTGFDSLLLTLGQLGKEQGEKLGDFSSLVKKLTESNRAGMEEVRKIIDARLKEMQEGNEKKLEQMRIVVDEKLQGTLEKRLGESFKLVSERLEAVQKGLGEMRNLAAGVGDLKRVLTNVKTRGTWGEVQLGALLEQILAPEQFERNVQTRSDSRETVEFAVRLPGPDNDPDSKVWLPIDAKFPQEDYLRLVEASEIGDADAVQTALTALNRSIRNAAKDISSKYLSPPETTDFAILFLPTEGLYAETVRQPGLLEKLQNEYRVVVAGPTTLAALLNSLRMGFRTLAIEKRSSEVWKVLAGVKMEFGKFGVVLDKVKKQLETASNTIDQTHVRTRAIERKLRSVETLPSAEAAKLFETPGDESQDEETEDGQ